MNDDNNILKPWYDEFFKYDYGEANNTLKRHDQKKDHKWSEHSPYKEEEATPTPPATKHRLIEDKHRPIVGESPSGVEVITMAEMTAAIRMALRKERPFSMVDTRCNDSCKPWFEEQKRKGLKDLSLICNFIVADRPEILSGSKVAIICWYADGSTKKVTTRHDLNAMKLVIEAKGYTDYPELLQSIELSDSDKALSPQEKMRLATEMVLNDEYYNHKYLIRENMTISLEELEKMAYDKDEDAMAALSNELKLVRVVIILQTFGIVILVWLTTKLGIHPVLNAVDRIKEDSPIPEGGAVEFRYLAKAYNKMYEVYRKSLESLSFRASHDELSGLYNRAGYDLLLSSIDLESTYMLLFDVDNFKTINDNYGHGAGDEAIRNVARVLKENFRSDDYVCRIGGDEFVVLMVHAPKSAKNLISSKIKHINDELGNSRDNLPSYSVSVGIAHGSDSTDAINLFAKCDTALYESKARGKHTYTFADI